MSLGPVSTWVCENHARPVMSGMELFGWFAEQFKVQAQGAAKKRKHRR